MPFDQFLMPKHHLCFFIPVLLSSPAIAAEEPQQVVVKAKLQQVLNLADRKVYQVGSDLQAATGNAVDVLNNIPSVTADVDGNISLRGDSKVLILIDGKPSVQISGSGAGDALTQYSAQNIDRIEVMTVPPAEYQATGSGGVINIITKKGRAAGASGSLQANIGNKRRAVLGAVGSYNTDRLKLTGSAGLRQDDRERVIDSALAEHSLAGTDQKSHDQLFEQARRLIPSARADVNYQLDDKRALEFDVNFRERSGDRFFDQYSTTSGDTSRRHSDGHEWSMSGEQSLRWRQTLSTPDESLEATLHRSTDLEREHYAYLTTSTVPSSVPMRDHLYLSHDFVSNEASLDYRKALAEDSLLKLGVTQRRDNNGYANAGDNVDPVSGRVVPNPDLTNIYRYVQTVRAWYGAYETTAGDWALVAGLRGEVTTAEGGTPSGINGYRQHYRGLYPSLHLERALDKITTLSFALGRRIARPDPEELNPYVDHQDIHNLRAGNPNLRPQETETAEAGWRQVRTGGNLGLTFYLRRIHNSVTDITVPIASDVVLSTKTNLPTSHAGGAEFSGDTALTPFLSARASGNLVYSQIDASALGFNGTRSSTGINFKGSLDYRPTTVDTLQLSLSRSGRRLTPQGDVAPITLVNLGFKHQLPGNLVFVATVSDAFNGQRFERTLDTASFQQHYRRAQLGRIAYVGVSYQFGAPKKAKSSGFDYDQ